MRMLTCPSAVPQMLVYENYNKFISATDIIRSMKSNVDGMDATMQELRSRLGAAEPPRPVLARDDHCRHSTELKRHACRLRRSQETARRRLPAELHQSTMAT